MSLNSSNDDKPDKKKEDLTLLDHVDYTFDDERNAFIEIEILVMRDKAFLDNILSNSKYT